MLEGHAPLDERVEIRRDEHRVAQRAQTVRAMIVRVDVEDVRPLRRHVRGIERGQRSQAESDDEGEVLHESAVGGCVKKDVTGSYGSAAGRTAMEDNKEMIHDFPAFMNSPSRKTPSLLARIVHTQLDPMHFTESTAPSPQKSQSGQGVWLRALGADLGALWEKDFLQKVQLMRVRFKTFEAPLDAGLLVEANLVLLEGERAERGQEIHAAGHTLLITRSQRQAIRPAD